MANRVFFSFHYQDVIDFRANVLRNHWVAKADRVAAGLYDASIWEEAKRQGNVTLKRLINSGLQNTSNTCVLTLSVPSDARSTRVITYHEFNFSCAD